MRAVAFVTPSPTAAASRSGSIRSGCCRANVAAIQQYTRQLPPLLAQLRSFVKDNDQINATLVYNQVVTLVANFKAAAKNVGVNVGG